MNSAILYGIFKDLGTYKTEKIEKAGAKHYDYYFTAEGLCL